MIDRSNRFAMNKALSKRHRKCKFWPGLWVSKPSWKIPQTELEKILAFAKEVGIEIIDTAHAYGDSEARIGSVVVMDVST